MNKRINIEYAINAVISAVFILIGAVVTYFCASGIIDMQQQFDNMNSSDNGLLTLLFIFLGPVMAIAIGVAIIILIVCGIVPILVGAATGVLSYIARFNCTEGGTVITPKYKTLMTANYVIIGVFSASYAAGFITLVIGSCFV